MTNFDLDKAIDEVVLAAYELYAETTDDPEMAKDYRIRAAAMKARSLHE